MENQHLGHREACFTTATITIKRRSATRMVARRTRSVCRRFSLLVEPSKPCRRARKPSPSRSSTNQSVLRLLSNLNRRTTCAITITTTWAKFPPMATYSTFRPRLSKSTSSNNSSSSISRLSQQTINLCHPRRRFPQQYNSTTTSNNNSNTNSTFFISSNSIHIIITTCSSRSNRSPVVQMAGIMRLQRQRFLRRISCWPRRRPLPVGRSSCSP